MLPEMKWKFSPETNRLLLLTWKKIVLLSLVVSGVEKVVYVSMYVMYTYINAYMEHKHPI